MNISHEWGLPCLLLYYLSESAYLSIGSLLLLTFLELTVIFTASFYINFYIILNHFWIRKGDVKEPQKYKNALLSIEEEVEILLKLHNIMEMHKMYIDFEISLPKVASKTDSKPYKLSQVIKKRLNMTFNEFITFSVFYLFLNKTACKEISLQAAKQ